MDVNGMHNNNLPAEVSLSNPDWLTAAKALTHEWMQQLAKSSEPIAPAVLVDVSEQLVESTIGVYNESMHNRPEKVLTRTDFPLNNIDWQAFEMFPDGAELRARLQQVSGGLADQHEGRQTLKKAVAQSAAKPQETSVHIANTRSRLRISDDAASFEWIDKDDVSENWARRYLKQKTQKLRSRISGIVWKVKHSAKATARRMKGGRY
ncbi:hypothetical protein FN846DRAFT_893034 [Sphaerosporella brunnea]|uniref:Uncharacterized protein n=1 Tax=Sphaerosporella brunnea TaxID=1250544 RepID=A0A5J5ENC8_9PEZI|nr:hypothetical protein FN846DRAFT_893034 [Sphaerosporella brunnea]